MELQDSSPFLNSSIIKNQICNEKSISRMQSRHLNTITMNEICTKTPHFTRRRMLWLSTTSNIKLLLIVMLSLHGMIHVTTLVSSFSPKPTAVGIRLKSSHFRKNLSLVEEHHGFLRRNNPFLLERTTCCRSLSTDETSEVHSDTTAIKNNKNRDKKRLVPKKIFKTYVNYMTKLWRQTDPEEREKVAAQQALSAIKRVKHIMEGEEYVDVSHVYDSDTLEDVESRITARDELLSACNQMLECLEKVKMQAPAMMDVGSEQNNAVDEFSSKETSNSVSIMNGNTTKDSTPSSSSSKKKKKKKSRSILFGATMGAITACWVFSGNFVFTTLFTLMTALGQLEYYRMVMKTGVYPARRISVLGACSMFVTALFAPNLHQICLPVFATYAMIWFLTMRRKVSTIPEIATTFTGMFYLGYIPSFWVRIRLIGGSREPTRLAPILGPILEALGQKASSLPAFLPKCIHLPITSGAVFIFWTWISIAFSDVGAYFAGRKYGKTKLGKIAPAAGAASPNKTVEGYLGGTLFSACFATAGAWVMRWPYWYITGPLHGMLLAFLGLVGDLTASMLKRDSGMKDFGDLLPEHGGIMDRVDSFIFTAPYSWLMIQFIIPALKMRQGLAVP